MLTLCTLPIFVYKKDPLSSFLSSPLSLLSTLLKFSFPHGIAWMFTHSPLLCMRVFICSGPKGPQKITNWGPAAFTEAELSLREKDWQERKNRPDQTQWGIIAGLPAMSSCTSNHYWMGKHWPSGSLST